MNYRLLFLLLLLPWLVMGQNEYYQPEKQPIPAKRTYRIILKDGTQLRGELIRQDSTEALIRTNNIGEVRLKAEQIVRIEQENTQVNSDFYPNLFSQTMRIMPTAFSAEKSKLYYRNYYLYFSQFEYGITDSWSVGTTFYSFAPTNLFSLNTKLSLPVSSRVRLGVSAQYAAVRSGGIINNGSSNFLESIGYLQGIVTTGDRQNNTTFGVGWSVSNGELSRNVIGTFGLVRKVSPKLTFISENSVLFGGGNVSFAGVLSAGIRFDRQRHAFDLAAYFPFVVARNNPIPLLLMPFGSYHLRISK